MKWTYRWTLILCSRQLYTAYPVAIANLAKHPTSSVFMQSWLISVYLSLSLHDNTRNPAGSYHHHECKFLLQYSQVRSLIELIFVFIINVFHWKYWSPGCSIDTIFKMNGMRIIKIILINTNLFHKVSPNTCWFGVITVRVSLWCWGELFS